MNLERYSIELNNISEKLYDLKQGNYHERLKKPGIPTAMKIAYELEREFVDLLKKIKDDLPGTQEVIDENVEKINFVRK